MKGIEVSCVGQVELKEQLQTDLRVNLYFSVNQILTLNDKVIYYYEENDRHDNPL